MKLLRAAGSRWSRFNIILLDKQVAKMVQKKILVQQTRSGIRTPKPQKLTLKALGLGRIGKQAVHRKDEATLGMIRRVAHLVTAKEISE